MRKFSDEVSYGDYMAMMLLGSIPCVGLYFMIRWIIDGESYQQAFAKACLIVYIGALALMVLAGLVLGSIG